VEQRWDERELVRRCKEGSEAAYAELVHQHRRRLMNLAFRLVGSRELAEDVVQETFLSAFRAMERFQPKPALAPWLNTICVRQAGRVASKRAAIPTDSLDRLQSTGSDPNGDGGGRPDLLGSTTDLATDPHAVAEAADLRRELEQAMAALPFKQRAAVVLRFVIGLDYAEAAHAMDIPLNTYKSHLLRGTRALRETLGPRLEARAMASWPASGPPAPRDATPRPAPSLAERRPGG